MNVNANIQRPEEGMDLLELELQITVSCPTWMLGTELSPTEKQQALLSAEPSPQALLYLSLKGNILTCNKVIMQ